ncbi:MAG: exosortase [Akkermansiaceae bacterium]|jgi:exosortase
MDCRHGTAFLFLGILWIQLCFVLFPSWQNQTYYDYGWIVAPLILFFGFHRWQDFSSKDPHPTRAGWQIAAIALGPLILVPIRFVEHVDIYWRLPLWIHALVVLTLSHLTIALLYDRRTSQNLLPATLFILLAVPLPSRIETPLVHGLTQVVLEFTSFLLPLNGYPIETSGTSFIVNGEIFDVAEGCSGIRSFQSGIVAALALGELNRFSSARRLTFLVLSLGLAVLTNSHRVYALAQIAHESGRQEMNAAHDALGFGTMIATFSSIALLAWFMARRPKKPSPKKGPSQKKGPPIPSKSTRTDLRPLFISVILLLGASEGFRLWWFELPTQSAASPSPLIWNVPDEAIDRRFSETRGGKILDYDRGMQVLLEDKKTPVKTEVTYLEYYQGNDRILLDLYLHSPEVCFPASGIQLVKELPFRTFRVAGRDFFVRQWLFKHPVSEEPLYVCKLIWSSDDYLLRQTLYKRNLKMARLRAVMARREFAAARMILAVISGVSTANEAWTTFEEKVISRLSVKE